MTNNYEYYSDYATDAWGNYGPAIVCDDCDGTGLEFENETCVRCGGWGYICEDESFFI